MRQSIRSGYERLQGSDIAKELEVVEKPKLAAPDHVVHSLEMGLPAIVSVCSEKSLSSIKSPFRRIWFGLVK